MANQTIQPKDTNPDSKEKCKMSEDKIKYVDYKNVKLLTQYIDRFGRIKARRYTGTSLRYQKQLARAIKNARYIGLMPFVRKRP